MEKYGIDPERQRKAKRYARMGRRLLLANLALGTAFILAMLFGLSSWLKRWLPISQPQAVLALYFVAFFGAFKVLSAPLSYYRGYVLPHRFDLSVQSLGSWLADQAKGTALGLILGLMAMEAAYWLLSTFPSMWWLLAGLLYLLFSVILSNLAPILIIPLFFKFTPLKDEELVERLKRLAERAGTRVRGVFTLNLSTKTKTANAALIGLGNTRRIVLGDTLLKDYDADEIEAILAHELGHHVHRDIWWGIVVQSAIILVGLFLTNLLLRWGVGRFGFAGLDDIAAFPLLAIGLGGWSVFTTPLANSYSRWRERMADGYSLRATAKPRAFISAMAKLANQNLAEVDPSPWVEFLLYDHPSIARRIRHAESFSPPNAS